MPIEVRRLFARITLSEQMVELYALVYDCHMRISNVEVQLDDMAKQAKRMKGIWA